MQTSYLGTRMKEYESRNQYYLQKRTPVVIFFLDKIIKNISPILY